MSAKVWVAYINDDGPALCAFADEGAALAFCREMDRILAWRNRPRTDENDDDDFGRDDLPPDDWTAPRREGTPMPERYQWAVTLDDLPLESDPMAASRSHARDFNRWGEYEP